MGLEPMETEPTTYTPGTWRPPRATPAPIAPPTTPAVQPIIIHVQQAPTQAPVAPTVRPRPWHASGAGFGWILMYLLVGVSLAVGIGAALLLMFDGEIPGWP